MKRRNRGISVIATALIVFAVTFPSFVLANPSMALLDGPGDIRTSPSIGYQDVPFDYHVTITNSGNESLHVTEIILKISWPDQNWMFPEYPIPSETYKIFSGDQVLKPGENHEFRNKVTSGFFGGGFAVTVTVSGRSESNDLLSTQRYTTTISFDSRSNAPVDRTVWFPLLLPIFFGAFWVGFYIRKSYWSVEIDNAMKNGNPGDIGFGK
ncbi:MAG TPA: hypothetical protein VGK23_04310, partial [Methanomassiliicoccales archaeon]